MSAPLRIAIVASYPAAALLPPEVLRPEFRDGPSQHPSPWLRSLCRALTKRDDVEVAVFIDTRAVTDVHRVMFEGTELVFIPRREPRRCSPYLLEIPPVLRARPHIAEWAPDVVHGFGTQGANGMVAVSQKRPSIVSLQGIVAEIAPHTSGGRMKRMLEARIERHVLRHATALIAKTEFARRWAHSIDPKADVHLIPNALHPEFLTVTPASESRNILSMASLEPWKGPDTVLRAFAHCPRDARLLLAGSGSMECECRDLAATLGIAERVTFLGHVKHDVLPEHLSRAALVVLGSRMDTSPNAVLEAHAAGLPVVATDAGGIPDMIDDGRTGFVVPVDDHVAMGERMTLLLEDHARRTAMGAEGKRVAAERHDPDRVAAQHVKVYGLCATGHQSSAE